MEHKPDMPAVEFTRFGFRIRTRSGSIVENLVIAGRDEADATRKLQQMYRDCQILECVAHKEDAPTAAVTFEDIANLISR
jgi:hypothetical protein